MSVFVLDLSSGRFLPWKQVRDVTQPPLVLNNCFLLILVSNHTSPDQDVSIIVFDATQFKDAQVETVTMIKKILCSPNTIFIADITV